MKNKNFKVGFDSLLEDGEQKPKTDNVQEMRSSFILKIPVVEKIKSIAYWDRKKITTVIEEALTNYINNWEALNGEVKPRGDK